MKHCIYVLYATSTTMLPKVHNQLGLIKYIDGTAAEE